MIAVSAPGAVCSMLRQPGIQRWSVSRSFRAFQTTLRGAGIRSSPSISMPILSRLFEGLIVSGKIGRGKALCQLADGCYLQRKTRRSEEHTYEIQSLMGIANDVHW